MSFLGYALLAAVSVECVTLVVLALRSANATKAISVRDTQILQLKTQVQDLQARDAVKGMSDDQLLSDAVSSSGGTVKPPASPAK